MKVRKVAVPTQATDLFTLMGQSQRHVSGIFIQAPKKNIKTIFFGDPSIQLFELRPEASGEFAITDTAGFFIHGTVGDFLIVGLL